VIPFAARLPVHRHAVVVVVRKLALILTCVVHHPVQPPRLIVAVTPQQLRLPFRVMAEDARHALRVRCQLIVQPDAGALPIAADFHQTPVVVVGQYQREFAYDDNDCMTMHREPGGERYYYTWAWFEGPDDAAWRVTGHHTDSGEQY
ncbi:hypothetical protein, partial [Salmonella enterica]|uniref:hypothetical protein n=1 Tax=Salmonella enterica TaxID=28901 RepID=UPI0015C4EFA4